MQDPVVVLKGVHCRLGTRTVLQGLDLALAGGSVHALVGANGAGKSTLMRLLLGFVQTNAGSAEILGQRCDRLSPALRGRIAYVQEDHALPGAMRVGELLAVQRRRHAARWQVDVLQGVLERFALEPMQRVDGLSRGERAGLALALALAQGPELLLLDEPTLGLDVAARRSFLEALLQVGLVGHCTVLYASHHMEEVERLAETLIVLRDGRTLLHDTPDALVSRVRCWQAEFPFGAPERLPCLPGQLSHMARGPLREWLLLDADPQAVRATLQTAGAARMGQASVGLERALGAVLELPR